MKTTTKRILFFAALAALVAGFLAWPPPPKGGDVRELPEGSTTAVRRKLPVGTASPERRAPRAAAAVTTKKGLAASPKPASEPGGEIFAYRSAVLPPEKKGQPAGVLREWLVAPKEGYPIHVEERYRPDETGGLRLEERREYAANQILVTLDAGVDFDSFRREMARHGATAKEPLMDLEKGGKIVAVIVPEATFEAVENLRQIVRAFDGRLDPEADPVVRASRVPSDARYAGLWGMKRIEAPEAWDLGVAATNVTVAVMDTGVNYHHEDLTANVPRDTERLAFPWIEGFRSIGGKTSADPMDDHGHGSHCAGTIAGRGDNGIGVAGVTWRTRIMPLKFLDEEGRGYTSDQILCYRFIRDHGADFVNCSFGGGGYSGAAETAIRQLKILGVTLVCAAGNGDLSGHGLDNDAMPMYPSSYDVDNVVAVASTGGEDALSEFSNYGTNSVDVAAPGEDILSTCYSFRNADKCYETLSGTSMATPHVAGALALLRGLYPDDHYRQTIQRLLLNGDRVDSLTNKVATGMRINLRKAMLSLVPPAPVATATAGVHEDRVEVSWRPVGGATHYRLWRAWSEESENKVPLTGWTTDCSFADTTAEPGTGYHYYVKASKHPDGADASPYSLAAVGYKLAPLLDDWDPRDDEPETATVVTPTGEEQTHGGHSLSRWDGRDWFRIDMAAGHTYRLESTGSGDVAAELYDFPGTNDADRVAFDDDSGTEYNFRIVYTPESDGTRYLRVRNVQEGTDAFYQLRHALVGWTDEFDPDDDTTVGATAIEPVEEGRSHGLHSLSAADAQDLFRAELEAGRTYVFSTTGDTDTFGELYAESIAAGNLVAWNDDGHAAESGSPLNFRIVYTPASSGTYFLRVRLAASGASAGTYRLAYARQADTFDLEFTDAETCAFVSGWAANPMLATNAGATAGAASFTTADRIYAKWAFNEAEGRDIAGTVTNLIEVLNADGVRIVWGHAVADAVSGDEFVDFTTELPPLPAGGYTVRMTLNADVDGAPSLAEAERGDNVRLAGFTVVDEAKSVVSLEISGPAEVASKRTAKYGCTATLADGTTMDAQPAWYVFEGGEHATIAADGTLSAAAVSEPATVRLRAVLNGCLAFKLVTVAPAAGFPEDPFPDPVLYPSLPMVVEATVSIDGVPAEAGDEVAAYAGPQVRGRGKVTADGRVTLPVSVACPGEAITFKVWDASAGDSGAVLACGQSIYGMPGFLYGGLALTAVTSDPFGVPVVGGNKYLGWKPGRIYARVTINGEPAETGDMLAVYDGESLVGKAFVTRTASFGGGPGDALCTVEVNVVGRADLSFVVWDRSAGKRCGVAGTMEMGANDRTIGSSGNPVLVAADDRTQMTMSLASPGWHFVSFNVLPDEPTHGNVFGGADGVAEVRPATDAYEIGEAYWVLATNRNTTWTLSGHGEADKEIALSPGWNAVGYALPRAGRIEDVLRRALVDGRVASVADDVESYPLGTLSTMHPGKGYWILATRPCRIAYQSSGMLAAAGSGAAGFGPFGDGDDLVRDPVEPTRFVGVEVRFGERPAAYGDCVALYDGEDRLRAVGRVADDDGTVSFPAYVGAGTVLKAKVWNSAEGATGAVREATANRTLSIQAPGGDVEGLVLSVSGEGPAEVVVSFDLGEHGTRVGGGALVQTVSFGSDAVAPEVSCDEGYAFDHWSRPFSNVRADTEVSAVYRDAGAPPSIPDEPPAPARRATVSFDANGGTGTMAETTIDFDSAGDRLDASAFRREGERFVGWSLSPNGPVVVKDAASAAEVAAAIGMASGEIVLYAQWASDGYRVEAGTFVANAGSQVTVPLRFESGRELSCVGARITYDPKILALVRVGEGTLAKAFSDDFTVSEPEPGVVSIGLFAPEDVVPGKGTLAGLTFAVRDGTADLFSDVTIADVQLAESSGVKDVAADAPVSVVNGMVRVMRDSAEASRLENSQIVAADTTLGRLVLDEGDGIQASDFQTPVVVSSGVSGADAIPVASPVNGWAGGRYALLKTPTQGLSFVLEDVDGAVFTEETVDGMTTYYAAISFKGEIPVYGVDEKLSAGTQNQIRELVARKLDDVEQIEVSGPQGLVGLIADLGISPSCTRAGTTLRASYSMPEIRITDFQPDTGLLRIRVFPGEGNEIVSKASSDRFHVYGTDDLRKDMARILKVGVDLAPYLRDETRGEAELRISMGTHTFFRVVAE